MNKIGLSLLMLTFFAKSMHAQSDQYGPYIGGNAFVYKSNLYNSMDKDADSIQKFAITMGFGGGFDFGYKYQNGISISSGLWFGTTNQNYKKEDTITGDVLNFNAKTTMSFLKIPLVFSMQTRNDKKLKMFYNLGLFYSLNTGYSESATWNFKYGNDLTTTIKKDVIENTIEKDSNKYSSVMSERPYRRHGWGAIVGLGVSKQINKNAEWYCQMKIEYQISSSENNNEIVFTPTAGSLETKRAGYVWGNYAKYVRVKNSNYNRAATHPFNLGLNFGIRYYLFDFE